MSSSWTSFWTMCILLGVKDLICDCNWLIFSCCRLTVSCNSMMWDLRLVSLRLVSRVPVQCNWMSLEYYLAAQWIQTNNRILFSSSTFEWITSFFVKMFDEFRYLISFFIQTVTDYVLDFFFAVHLVIALIIWKIWHVKSVIPFEMMNKRVPRFLFWSLNWFPTSKNTTFHVWIGPKHNRAL